MQTIAQNLDQSDVSFKMRSGLVEKGDIKSLSRYDASFSIYGPEAIVEVSESLDDFAVTLKGQVAYRGRAVVKAAVPEPGGLVCNVVLDADGWRDIPSSAADVRHEFKLFMEQASRRTHLVPEYKLVVSEMNSILSEMRHWVGQLELSLANLPEPQRIAREHALLDQLRPVAMPIFHSLFERYEVVAENVPASRAVEHAAHIKAMLHPIVLCSPFMHRTFAKPLGYPGDYEMVAMMARDPYEGRSTFAKLLNSYFLDTSPVLAHRQRLGMLTDILFREASKAAGAKRTLSVFNLGCGPAWEIRDFLAQHDVSNHVRFTLLDFNEETTVNTGNALREQARRHGRSTTFKMVCKSVAQVLKESAKGSMAEPTERYDVVYCAGLFDYLNDAVCERLVEVFYKLASPGGLVVVTNVDSYNPCQNWMEDAVDWHLVYRNSDSMRTLVPDALNEDDRFLIRSDFETGVNIFLEIRKRADGKSTPK